MPTYPRISNLCVIAAMIYNPSVHQTGSPKLSLAFNQKVLMVWAKILPVIITNIAGKRFRKVKDVNKNDLK